MNTIPSFTLFQKKKKKRKKKVCFCGNLWKKEGRTLYQVFRMKKSEPQWSRVIVIVLVVLDGEHAIGARGDREFGERGGAELVGCRACVGRLGERWAAGGHCRWRRHRCCCCCCRRCHRRRKRRRRVERGRRCLCLCRSSSSRHRGSRGICVLQGGDDGLRCGRCARLLLLLLLLLLPRLLLLLLEGGGGAEAERLDAGVDARAGGAGRSAADGG